jgi:molybdopterin converting factor small subunit
MNITVQIPTALRRLTAGNARVVCSAANLGELFTALDQQFPDLKPHLRDEAGEIRRFLNVYVNEEDIRFLGGNKYAFQDGDEVLLVPSIAGGVGVEALRSDSRFSKGPGGTSDNSPPVQWRVSR